MKEPKRLFESGSPLEQNILGFGRDEGPSDHLAKKTLAAMAAAPTARAAASSQRPSRWAQPKAIYAGIAIIGLGAILVTGVVSRRSEPVPAAPVVIAAAPEPRASEPAPAPLTDESKSVASNSNSNSNEVVVTPESLPSIPPAPSVGMQPPPVRSVAPNPPPVGSASIAREVELLDAVKARLNSGEAAAASRSLDAYDAEFPAGTLRPEATVLRIRTLLLRGDRASAEKLGTQFLAQHPSGVHAKRVRALLGDASERGRSEK
ncbi:MAG: hypothetical protein K0S65_5418 [Labilithrix sp.]|nr:hypothetical protein [Labilithrix sp.]